MPDYRITKHRGKYVLTYGEPRVRKSLSTDDLGVAEARAKALWEALSKPKSDRVTDLWDIYVTDRVAEGVPVLDHKRCWKHLEVHFGYKLGHDVDKDDCRRYIAFREKQKAAASTIRQELTLLRACLNLRYGKGNTHLTLPAPSAPRERFLTKAEAEKLLEHVETPHVRLFITLAITTGARMTAILETKWDQVDLKHNTINYNPTGRHATSKGRTRVPLNSRALVAIKEAKRVAKSDYVVEYAGEGIKSIKWAVLRAGQRAKVPVSPHVFRHTAGVWMAEADVPMQKISQYLGHASTAITEKVYARYSPTFMKDAADALDW